jgi:putative molybdopterin biosynthesis protein
VQQINLFYNWTPHQGDGALRQQTRPLRNPLMDMLQAVREAGSISAAAKTLQLSYRHVWGELKRWEQALEQPLILWEKGQAARLSEFADKLLWAERQAQARLAPQISALHAELEKTFSVAFDPESHLLTVYASHDDALVQLQQQAAQKALHLDIRFCGSVDAIRALNEGRCTVAGFHAPHRPERQRLIAQTYAPLLQTGQHKLIGFAMRRQGLMVAAGNPLRIRGWQDLLRKDVRFVNRTLGTGTRLLLDDWLQRQGLDAGSIRGYALEEPSHAAVAACVASKQADCGLGVESAAHARQLDFVELEQEHYWLVCLKSALETPAVVQLRHLLQSQDWRKRTQTLPGYQWLDDCGQVQALKKTLPWWLD